MKVGDLVRFTREHVLDPGFAYCSDWKGIIIKRVKPRAELNEVITVHWTCPDHGTFSAEYTYDDEFFEVISESR